MPNGTTTACTVVNACAGTFTCSRGLLGYRNGYYRNYQQYTGYTQITAIPTPLAFAPYKDCQPATGWAYAFPSLTNYLGNASRLCSSILQGPNGNTPLDASTEIYMDASGKNGGTSNSSGNSSGGSGSSCTGSGRTCPPGYTLTCIGGVYHCI